MKKKKVGEYIWLIVLEITVFRRVFLINSVVNVWIGCRVKIDLISFIEVNIKIKCFEILKENIGEFIDDLRVSRKF